MRSHTRHYYIPRDTISLAGWLFADLLLGLSMLFFVFNTVGPETQEEATPTPTPSPTRTATHTPVITNTPTPTNTATVTPTFTATPEPTNTPEPTKQISLSTSPVTQLIKTDPNKLLGGGTSRTEEENRIRSILRQQFAQYEAAHQRAGIVLAFGTAPSSVIGGRLSSAVNGLLVKELPQVFVSGSTVLRDFHYISANRGEYGNVEIEVYFLLGSP